MSTSLPAGADGEAAPLRGAALGDVDVGEDLDAGHDPGVDGAGRRHRVVEETVHAVANDELALVGLDVDVGGALLQGLTDHLVHQVDDGRVLGAALRLVGVQLLLLGHVLAENDRRLGQGLLHLAGTLQSPVVALAGLGYDRLGADHRVHAAARDDAQVVEGVEIEGIGHRHPDDTVVDAQRQDVVLAGQLGRHDRQRLGGDLVLAGIEERDAKLRAQEPGDVVLGYDA